MRLDKYLKVSRLIKRRTVANDAADGGRVTVNGSPAKPSKDVKPGDVITMRVPSGEYYVKRVAATAGETVELIDGDVYIDGSLMDDPWGEGETNEESGAVIYPYTVQDGNVFVLGDNREVSMDSRMFGEVNRRQIRGRMILVIGAGGIHALKQ